MKRKSKKPKKKNLMQCYYRLFEYLSSQNPQTSLSYDEILKNFHSKRESIVEKLYPIDIEALVDQGYLLKRKDTIDDKYVNTFRLGPKGFEILENKKQRYTMNSMNLMIAVLTAILTTLTVLEFVRIGLIHDWLGSCIWLFVMFTLIYLMWVSRGQVK